MTASILDLRGAVPATLPPAARDARGLVLADSDLAALPPGLGELTRLRVLDVAHNRLTALPETVAALRDLEARGCLVLW